MMNYVPVIASNQGAIPEFIQHQKNGYLLDIEVDEVGEWIHITHPDKSSQEYIEIFDTQVKWFANQMIDILSNVKINCETYYNIRQDARIVAEKMFSADAATSYWDKVYREATNN